MGKFPKKKRNGQQKQTKNRTEQRESPKFRSRDSSQQCRVSRHFQKQKQKRKEELAKRRLQEKMKLEQQLHNHRFALQMQAHEDKMSLVQMQHNAEMQKQEEELLSKEKIARMASGVIVTVAGVLSVAFSPTLTSLSSSFL